MRTPLPLLLGAALALPAVSRAAEARFMEHPDIAGESLVFAYEGDLWTVSAGGGTATRITSWPGEENFPRFSPDGQWIAFSADYDGAQAVYLIPAAGGEPRRLTWNPGGATALGWTPDGRRVLFRSMLGQFITRAPALYSVGREGGPVERLPVDRGTLASLSPDGGTLLYCRRGNEEYQWKRYRGGNNVDIWSYDFATKGFAQICDGSAKNAYPMWIGGAMAFLSDRGGVSNLWRMALPAGQASPLTSYTDYDVMMPETDGTAIVYLHDGYLHVLDPASGADRRVAVTAPSDRWRTHERVINPKDYIQSADVAGDGRACVFEARGDIFLVPVDPKGQTRNLSASPGTRERDPRLSPDGKQVAFLSDKSGEYQLYLQSVEGGSWRQLTTALDHAVYRPAWSPDGARILFGDKNLDLFVLTVATGELLRIPGNRRLKNDEFTWRIDDYAWSPDSRWIAYSQVAANRNSQVFLYELATRTGTAVTSDFYDNLHPCFDQNGDWLYFLSSRNTEVLMDFYEDNHVAARPYQVMALGLRAGQAPPFPENEPDSSDARRRRERREERWKREDEKRAAPAMQVDLEGIASRIWPLPVPAGNHFFLEAGRGKVLWASVPAFSEGEYEEIFSPGGATKWTLHFFDLEEKREGTLAGEIASFALSIDGRQLLARAEQEWRVIHLPELAAPEDAKPVEVRGEPVSLERMSCRVEPRAEWEQIFTDCWRWYRDFFYDPGMHGHDWVETGARYRAMLPDISSRGQLNWLMSQMVGELCVGHEYIGGGDEGPLRAAPPPVFAGLLGADLAADPAAGRWRLKRIYGPTDIEGGLRGPLARPDLEVHEGDLLLAVGGHELTDQDDYWRWLQVMPGEKVALTIARGPGRKGEHTVWVEPLRDERELRYAAWVAGNIRRVEEASGGRLGYLHVRAMGGGDVGQFDRSWRAFRYRDGLIIDVRRNSGGWTEYFLIDKLERRQSAFDVLQGMAPFVYPGSVNPRQAYVAISNEDNGSDGEAFIDHFQRLGLGPVVGTPSWGGLVGILNGQRTIDNGTVQQPNNAFYGSDGQWIVENRGALPDVLVDNDPASVMAGRDPQLERAIAELLKQVEEKPLPVSPTPPAYPRK